MKRFIVSFVLLLNCACGFEPPGFQGFKCAFDRECPEGQICEEGTCAAPGTLNNPSNNPSNNRPGDMGADMTTDLPQPVCDTDVDGDGFKIGPGCAPEVLDCDDTSGQVYPGAPRVCNGEDNDCDGLPDREACACQGEESEPCGESLGECVAGTRTCAQGMWGPCMGRVGPTEEVCDTRDNDCDGEIDETFAGDGERCETGMTGACGMGSTLCVDGAKTCVAQQTPEPEICDGLDNDCDGQTDEDEQGLALLDVCQNSCPGRTYKVCSGGTWSACDVTSVERCDSMDNDCDGQADNIARCFASCNGIAIEGTLTCSGAGGMCELPGELCGDGIDNDCDGQTDEGCPGMNPLVNMVYIPGGKFLMGSLDTDFAAADDEKPIHEVTLAAFYIDRTEVTRAEYLACIQAGVCARPIVGGECLPQDATGSGARLPVTCILGTDAATYCGYVSKRLPTEAEWEKTARGPFPRAPLYPWGDSADLNLTVMECPGDLNTCLRPVDSFTNAANYYGVLHMSGNVSEVVFDFYLPEYYASSPQFNPVQRGFTNEGRTLRGGAWNQNLEFGRTANRAAEFFGISAASIGIRCARDAP